MRERRIGTITMGVCLVVFGVLFLVHIFGGFLNYELIFHLWPLILIGLGMEILFYTCIASGADRTVTGLNKFFCFYCSILKKSVSI